MGAHACYTALIPLGVAGRDFPPRRGCAGCCRAGGEWGAPPREAAEATAATATPATPAPASCGGRALRRARTAMAEAGQAPLPLVVTHLASICFGARVVPLANADGVDGGLHGPYLPSSVAPILCRATASTILDYA